MPTVVKLRVNPRSVAIYSVLLGWCFIVYFPLYWTVITSLKLPVDISRVTYLPWIDFHPSLNAWNKILLSADRSMFLRYFANSTVVALSSAGLAVLLGSMGGYGLSRFQYRWGPWRNNDIAFWFISQRMMPPIAVVLAFLVMYRRLGLLDTRVGLALAYASFNLPLVIWIQRDYFEQLSIEMEESALVDGASWVRTFWSIALPVALPGFVGAFILSFIFSWNEYLFALMLTFQQAGTVPLLLVGQVTGTGIQWWTMSALTVVSIVPSVICAILLERFIVAGLFAGGSK